MSRLILAVALLVASGCRCVCECVQPQAATAPAPLLPGCEGGCIDYGVPGVQPVPITPGWFVPPESRCHVEGDLIICEEVER